MEQQDKKTIVLSAAQFEFIAEGMEDGDCDVEIEVLWDTGVYADITTTRNEVIYHDVIATVFPASRGTGGAPFRVEPDGTVANYTTA